jgi:cytochrome c biogenesis protein CcmG, thiol:disulfide interchange protein DsbE
MSSTPGDRRARRQATREAARRSGGSGGSRSPMSRWLLPGLIVAAVAIAGVLAFLLPGTGPTTGGSSSVPPSASGAATAGSSSNAAGRPTISGDPLPPFAGPTGDGAVGVVVPTVQGADFSGTTVSIAADGRPKAIMFFAHWCPHCQAEVPLIQTWVSAGGVPQGVDLVSVATGIDPARPNYPPDAWLQREGWTVPVLVDPANTIAEAYRLTAYPFWVFVGPDGKVAGRAAGEMTIPNLEAMIGRLSGG